MQAICDNVQVNKCLRGKHAILVLLEGTRKRQFMEAPSSSWLIIELRKKASLSKLPTGLDELKTNYVGPISAR